MKKILLACISIATIASTPAFAGLGSYIPTGLEFGVGVSGTSGLNGFIGYANKDFESFWWKRLGVRLDFASTKPIKSTINSLIDKQMGEGIEVGDNLTITDGSIESKHFAALVDIYPFGNTWFLGGWRLTGGYVFGNMHVDALLTGDKDKLNQLAGREFQLGGNVWRYTGTATDVHGTANANWKFKGPYAGTGFDIGLFRGLKIFLDAGVVFTNKAAELSLDVPYDTVSAVLEYRPVGSTGSWTQIAVSPGVLNNTVVTILQNDIDKTIADAQKELNKYKFFPMVKIGFMYRF